MSDGRPDPRLTGRIGGLTAWARNDPATMLGPAHLGFRRRFERLVDPGGTLDPRERAIRADRARRAHMIMLSVKSAAARKKATRAIVTPPVAEEGDGGGRRAPGQS